MTQSNAACSGRRAPRKGRDYRGKICCFELAESAIEARARDRSASGPMGLDVLRSFATINPCCAARQTETDVDRVVRASREDVDVRTDGTSEAHSLPFRAWVLVHPWCTADPSTARSANLTTMGSFPQESSPRNLSGKSHVAVDGTGRAETVRPYLDAKLSPAVPTESRRLEDERAQTLSVLLAPLSTRSSELTTTPNTESVFSRGHAVLSFSLSPASPGRRASPGLARESVRASSGSCRRSAR